MRGTALLVAVLLAGCTDDPHADEDAAPRSTERSGSSQVDEPHHTEPLVLVTRADRPAVRLSTRAAEELLAGRAQTGRVVHAAATPEVEGAEVADERAVLRRVRRQGAIGALPARALAARIATSSADPNPALTEDAVYERILRELVRSDRLPGLHGLLESGSIFAHSGPAPDDPDAFFVEFGIERILDGIEAHVDRLHS